MVDEDMKTRVTSERSVYVFLRALWIILLVEVINEFVVAVLLHALGLTFGSFAIHFAKTVVVMTVALPVLIVYFLRDHWRVQREREISERVQDDYYQLFEANPDGVCLMDVTGKFIHANKSFLGFVGHDIHSLRQLPSHPFLTPVNKSRILHEFNLAKSGESVRFQAVLTDKNGLERPLEIIYVPKFDRGEVTGVHIVLKDIRKVIDTVNELQETRTYLDSLIDNTSDAIIIFKPNTEMLRVNQAFTSMYGWTEKEVLGKPIPSELFGDKREEGLRLIELVLNDKVVASRDTTRYTKNGKEIDINLTVSSIKNEQGEIIAVAGVSRDISAQKRVVRELQHTTNLLNSLFRYAGDAIIVVDADGRVASVNPPWVMLFGWTADEVRDKPFNTLMQNSRLDEILLGNTCVSQEQVGRRRDGSCFDVSVTGSAMYDEETGKVTGAILIYRDLTEKKQAEESLIRSEKLAVMGELAAGIAHEIRNPLTAIKGFLQMMTTSSWSGHLDILLSEVERISDITNELLLLAKPQAAWIQTEDAVAIVDEVIAFMRTQANMFSISIQTQYSSYGERLECVRSQIKQVLINLLKNAIEAMPHGGTIHVKVMGSKDEIRIAITDTGKGIPEDRIQSLGQPFYTTKERGAGLGLMVSYRIVENHHGRVHVSSRVGSGSCFEVILPRRLPSFGRFNERTNMANEL